VSLLASVSVGHDPLLTPVASSSVRDRYLPNLRAPVEILDRSVAHIYARNEAGFLFFAQGFNVARDRLFQIDLWCWRGLGQLR